MQTPSIPYLLIPAAVLGLLAGCGAPEQAEPVDPEAPESARLEPFEMLTGQAAEAFAQLSIANAGQDAVQYISFEYYR